MESSVYSKVERDALRNISDKLAEITSCGTVEAVLDLGNVRLARWKLDLIDRNFSQFDSLFLSCCDKISYEEDIDIPDIFPKHRFIFFEDIFGGMPTSDEMYQGLHYCIGEKDYSIKRY